MHRLDGFHLMLAAIVLGLAFAVMAFAAVVTGADVIECAPVSAEDRALYDEWGGRQQPPLKWVDCAEECVRGLRLCRFRERPPSRRDELHFAACNGRGVGEPCQLAPST